MSGFPRHLGYLLLAFVLFACGGGDEHGPGGGGRGGSGGGAARDAGGGQAGDESAHAGSSQGAATSSDEGGANGQPEGGGAGNGGSNPGDGSGGTSTHDAGSGGTGNRAQGGSGGTAGTRSDAGAAGEEASVARVEIEKTELAVALGATLTLVAHAFDASGDELSASFSWDSADSSVATVLDGVVTGVDLGQTTITASAGGVTSAPFRLRVNHAGTVGNALGRAVKAGEITADQALVYRIFYVFGDPRFPERFRGTQPDPGDDDLLMVEASQRFAALTAEQQDAIVEYFFPPPYRDLSGISTTSALRLGLASGANVRPVCPEGRRPSNGWKTVDSDHFRVWYESQAHPEQAAMATGVSADAEVTFAKLVTSDGFRAPLSDATLLTCNGGDGRIDIFIDTLDGNNGETTPAGAVDNAYTSFIVLAPGKPRGTVAHELMHAIQLAYPNFLSPSFGWTMEATATWAADEVFPGDHHAWPYASDFITRFDQPLFFPNHYCSRGSADDACLADSHASLKMYGSYLFFLFASNKALPGVSFVRDYFEQVPLQSDSLAAIDFALISAGEGGLVTTWPKFVLSLWNKSPVPEVDSFRGIDSNTVNWQDLTNSTADYDLETLSLATSDPELRRSPTHKSTATGRRAESALNELSASYERYQFGGTVRSIAFFNGYSQKLEKLSAGVKATIGPTPHPVSLDSGYLFTSYATTPEQMKGRSVWALLKRRDRSGTATWTAEDWSTKPTVFLCQDKASEKIEELVLVYANGNFTTARTGAFDQNAIATLSSERSGVYASQTPCYKYRGSYEASFVHADGTDTFQTTSTLNADFVGAPRTELVTDGAREGTAFFGLRFTAVPDTIQFSTRSVGTLNSCNAGYALNLSRRGGAEVFSALPQFDHWLPLPGGPADYAYTGQGVAFRTLANSCAGGSKALPAPSSLDFNLAFTSFQTIEVGPGRLASPAEGIAGPIYDQGAYTDTADVTNTWCFAAMHQDAAGNDVEPQACP